MAVYTRLSMDDARALAARYGLGQVQSLLEIAEGVENSNFMLLTHKAGHAQRSILTIYEKRVAPEDLPFFLGMMEHLAARGIPCPRPLYTEEGKNLVELHGKKAALTTFLDGGGVVTVRNIHLKELGSWLARMHLAAEGFALSRPNALSLPGWQQIFDKISDKFETITPGLENLLREELAWLAANWPNDLPRGVIHADVFPDNVFYLGDAFSGIIDFYFACEDFFMYDLAIVMNAWCFEAFGDFNITKAGVLLAAYNKVRPISPAELDALPILCRGSAMRFLLTRAHDWIFHDPNALVQPKNPLEYLKKLKFHQQVKHHGEYGL